MFRLGYIKIVNPLFVGWYVCVLKRQSEMG
jgi:hypothetical protein